MHDVMLKYNVSFSSKSLSSCVNQSAYSVFELVMTRSNRTILGNEESISIQSSRNEEHCDFPINKKITPVFSKVIYLYWKQWPMVV